MICEIDDKKLGSVLKKIGLTDMKGLEEVNIFTDDGKVIHITNPKSELLDFCIMYHPFNYQAFFSSITPH